MSKGRYNPRTGVVEYSFGNKGIPSTSLRQPLKPLSSSVSLTSTENKVAVSFDDDGDYSVSSSQRKSDCLSVDDVIKIVSNVVSSMIQSEMKKLEERIKEAQKKTPRRKRQPK